MVDGVERIGSAVVKTRGRVRLGAVLPYLRGSGGSGGLSKHPIALKVRVQGLRN